MTHTAVPTAFIRYLGTCPKWKTWIRGRPQASSPTITGCLQGAWGLPSIWTCSIIRWHMHFARTWAPMVGLPDRAKSVADFFNLTCKLVLGRWATLLCICRPQNIVNDQASGPSPPCTRPAREEERALLTHASASRGFGLGRKQHVCARRAQHEERGLPWRSSSHEKRKQLAACTGSTPFSSLAHGPRPRRITACCCCSCLALHASRLRLAPRRAPRGQSSRSPSSAQPEGSTVVDVASRAAGDSSG